VSVAGHFADRLTAAVERKGASLCVGLDPDPARMPEGLGVVEFCKGIVDAVAGVAVAVKPQAAFFEAQGAEGWAALTEVCDHARGSDLLVIADAKRGDVPSTARAYVAAFAPLADAVTVNPYLGYDSLEPFLAREGLGVFVLVRTSNPGSMDLQDLPLADGRPLWQHVAGLVERWGADYVGSAGLSSARSLERRSRARWPKPGGCCPGPCSSCPGSALRARGPMISRQPSRSARRARSSRPRARSSTPAVVRTGRRPRRPRPSVSPASCVP
jgi:orotidine-5'-phosphate decarboxylase